VDPLPVLNGVQCQEAWFEQVAGVRIQSQVTLWNEKGELLASDRGELQLTAYGISGIPVFQISHEVAAGLAKKERLSISLKFHPGIPDALYQEYLTSHAPSVYGGMFPDKLLTVLRSDPDALKKRTLFCSPVAMNEFDKAQVTAGGIPVAEIEKETMESMICPGLYLVGEVVDVDGICGGYNLQWAWTSGYLAGKHAGLEVKGNL